MKRLLIIAVLLLMATVVTTAQHRVKVQGIAERGGVKVVTQGMSSVTKVTQTFPGSTVTIYDHGTTNLSSLCSDNAVPCAVLSNPLTANVTDASYSFYVNAGSYDLRFSGLGIANAFTLSDVNASMAFHVIIGSPNAPCNPGDMFYDPAGSATNTTACAKYYGCTSTNNPSEIPTACSQFSPANIAPGVFNLLSYGAKCDGVTADDTALAQALAAIGSNKAAILMPYTATGKCLLANTATIGTNITVDHLQGAAWLLTDTKTLTEPNILATSTQQICYNCTAGHGTLVTSTSPISPLWWGSDTPAFQAAITAAISSARGRTILVPAGTYTVTASMSIQGVMGIKFIGSGYQTIFQWAGNNSTPMFNLGSVANSEFSNFKILAAAATPLAEAFRIENSGVAVAPTQNHFHDLFIEGFDSGVGIGFRGKVGAGGDANNDFMLFTNVRVSNYSNSAWTMEGSQEHGWKMVNCSAFAASGIGKYAVAGGGSNGALANFFWDGGFVGQNTVSDFFLGTSPVLTLPTEIANVSSELSNRFLITAALGIVNRATLRNVRFAPNALNADGQAVQLHAAGPWVFVNCGFGDGLGVTDVKIFWESYQNTQEPSLAFIDSTIDGTETTLAGAFPGRVPTFMSGSMLSVSQLVVLSLDTLALNGGNGSSGAFKSLTELTTIAAAATTDTAIQIPANAIVMSVSVRVTTAIPTAASFTVTGTSSATVFNTAAVNTGSPTLDAGTKSCPFYNATAQTIRFTPNVQPAANTGRVRVVLVYYLSVPPAQ